MTIQAQVAALAPDSVIIRVNPENTFAGVFIGLSVPLKVAQTVAVPGGSPPEELHVTLAYLDHLDAFSEADLLKFSALFEALPQLADEFLPLTAKFAGSGLFTQAAKDVAYVGVDCPGLEVLQRVVADAARAADLPVSSEHGFTPHVTLEYVSKGAPHPRTHPPEEPFQFSTLEVWLAGTRLIFLPALAETFAKAQAPGRPDPRADAQRLLAELAADQHVLSAQDAAARSLADQAHGHHRQVFERLSAQTDFMDGPQTAAALHHATEAARARRVSDVE